MSAVPDQGMHSGAMTILNHLYFAMTNCPFSSEPSSSSQATFSFGYAFEVGCTRTSPIAHRWIHLRVSLIPCHLQAIGFMLSPLLGAAATMLARYMLGYTYEGEEPVTACVLSAAGTFIFQMSFLIYLDVTIAFKKLQPMSSMGLLGTSIVGTWMMLAVVLVGVGALALGTHLTRSLCRRGKENVKEKSEVEKNGLMNW